jgi:hypothetical protein
MFISTRASRSAGASTCMTDDSPRSEIMHHACGPKVLVRQIHVQYIVQSGPGSRIVFASNAFYTGYRVSFYVYLHRVKSIETRYVTAYSDGRTEKYIAKYRRPAPRRTTARRSGVPGQAV